jgi:hypothetical protein
MYEVDVYEVDRKLDTSKPKGELCCRQETLDHVSHSCQKAQLTQLATSLYKIKYAVNNNARHADLTRNP